MTQKSFFEYLNIAHIERIHSQLLSWIISKDCEAMNAVSKNNFINNLFSLVGERQILNVETEHNNIDILIETDCEIIIIENKIKSSQHSNQLERYQQYCDYKFKVVKPKFYYLTLIDENSNNDDWIRISYHKLFVALNQQTLIENSHSVILKEYLNYLKKLTTVVEDFKSRTKDYDMVFLDGKKKKSDKINFNYNNDFEKFIADNQLETILQKSFLNRLKLQMSEVSSHITDTRGDALIDFHIKNDIWYENRNYATIIQLQGKTIKFAFSIYGDKYGLSNKTWIEKIIPKMEYIALNNNLGYKKKCNKPTSKAYVSISKKMNINYWHMDLEELSGFIREEISNGKMLTETLINHLN
ncbi:MAG: PD-(D/E)XK nuclease family protein [Flavobacterium sp. JAD_PAG50586_2]|nr:MAG: PD-(D/E)XK nuclease family protein [Flavobacterium sp. JAD_PAG50586_2]